MIQDPNKLEKWLADFDPWADEKSVDELKRKSILLNEIPKRGYKHVLHVGCRQGFLTKDLPGLEITAVDFSREVIDKARKKNDKRISFKACSVFELLESLPRGKKYDLIVISRVLYSECVGNALTLIYDITDKLLADSGILVTTHVDEYYKGHFPYLLLGVYYCTFGDKTHKIEIYTK